LVDLIADYWSVVASKDSDTIVAEEYDSELCGYNRASIDATSVLETRLATHGLEDIASRRSDPD
jgi:hypothetical protein